MFPNMSGKPGVNLTPKLVGEWMEGCGWPALLRNRVKSSKQNISEHSRLSKREPWPARSAYRSELRSHS